MVWRCESPGLEMSQERQPGGWMSPTLHVKMKTGVILGFLVPVEGLEPPTP